MFTKKTATPPKKTAPAAAAPPKAMPAFSRDQVAEDTERDLTGKPQKYGAAMEEDESPAEEAGETPEQESAEAAPPEPAEGVDGDDASRQAGDEGDKVAALQAQNQDLQSRIEQIEQKLGLSQGKGDMTNMPKEQMFDPESGEAF